MKRIALTLATVCFIFVACNNQQEATPVDENQPKHECQHKKDGQHKPCKEMTEEQKAMCEAWKNWDDQTPEKKAELIAKKKECIDKKIAEQEAKEAEMKAKKEEFKAKWANFDKLDIDAKKALIDEFTQCHRHHKRDCGMKHEGCKAKKEECKK